MACTGAASAPARSERADRRRGAGRPGRSCFQLLDRPRLAPDAPLATIDLHESTALGIDKTTVDEYEGLVRQVFSVLGGPALGRQDPRKPGAKVLAISDAAAVDSRVPFRSSADLAS